MPHFVQCCMGLTILLVILAAHPCVLFLPLSYQCSGRSYYGSPDYECPHCHAVFWYGERIGSQSRSHSGQVIYNNCCKGGKVVIPPFLPQPEPLASLARYDGGIVCNKFLKSIRQYNCPFAFTSMGANID